ncbi:predicted protein [Naegleria gruberi]|uniref:Predicted protein n=1 Tax=Naegleria gruberi TaxID=5762 RepID=D2V1E5_NAEGR|nr:uncharacterized protein NAEGRDRAFT_45866 [Naegleria gruberi]EFC49152.1 predicted protein [Naegleria gruberi]|eukprot:XP_002681896.1 predicted protein [Naegleria gruberi strain NEG-M]
MMLKLDIEDFIKELIEVGFKLQQEDCLQQHTPSKISDNTVMMTPTSHTLTSNSSSSTTSSTSTTCTSNEYVPFFTSAPFQHDTTHQQQAQQQLQPYLDPFQIFERTSQRSKSNQRTSKNHNNNNMIGKPQHRNNGFTFQEFRYHKSDKKKTVFHTLN